MITPSGINVQWVDKEAVVLNEETGEIHYLNPQSALIYALLLEYGQPKATAEAKQRLDGPPDEIEREVANLLASFVEKGLLIMGRL